MAIRKYQNKSLKEFGFSPALLRTESSREFAKLVEEVNNDFQPQDCVHRIYVDDFSKVTWTILRYQRAQAAIIDNSFEAALTNVLRPLLLGSQHSAKADRPARDTAHGWVINDPEIRKRVSALFERSRARRVVDRRRSPSAYVARDPKVGRHDCGVGGSPRQLVAQNFAL